MQQRKWCLSDWSAQSKPHADSFLSHLRQLGHRFRQVSEISLEQIYSILTVVVGDSQVRAISILRNVQDALQAEQGAILQCNEAQAKSIQCQVLRLVDNLDNYYS